MRNRNSLVLRPTFRFKNSILSFDFRNCAVQKMPYYDFNHFGKWGGLLACSGDVIPVGLVDELFIFSKSVLLRATNVDDWLSAAIDDAHFQIYRRAGDSSNPVYLKCNSRFGMFVNGEKLKEGRTMLLLNGDKIAIGHDVNEMYAFENSVRPPILLQHAALLGTDWCGHRPQAYLGAGSGGKVVLINNRGTCKISALKRIKIEQHLTLAHQPGRNELQLLYQAQGSPHILLLRGGTYNLQHFFIETEYMSGGNLANRMYADPLQPNEIRDIAYQILRGLRHLHQNNIIHRDIKPLNILLRNQRNLILAKICDYSISTQMTNPTMVVGTPGFRAPEIGLIPGMAYTNKVDVYSFGETLKSMYRHGTHPINPEANGIVVNTTRNSPVMRPTVIELLRKPWFDDNLRQRVKTAIRTEGDENEREVPWRTGPMLNLRPRRN